MAQGADVVLEIDFQGRDPDPQDLRQRAVLILILPPSWEELRSRLERRGEDRPDVIELRLRNAATEMARAEIRLRYNQRVIRACGAFDLKAIVHAQRLRYSAQRRARADTFAALNIP